MVVLLFILLSLFCLPTIGYALSVNELIELQRIAYDKEQQRINRLDAQDLKNFSGKLKSKNSKIVPSNNKQSTVQTEKYSKPEFKNKNNNSINVSNKINKEPDTQTSIGGSIEFDQLIRRQYTFGISLGTILYGEIKNDFISTDPSLVEIKLTKAYVGKKNTIPINTLIWGNKTINFATKRIEISLRYGITPTPDSREFDIIGFVFDANNQSGIAGMVVENTKNIISSGINESIVSLSKAGLSAIAAGSIAGSALTQGISSAVTDTKRTLDANLNTNIIIYANSQPVILKIGKSF